MTASRGPYHPVRHEGKWGYIDRSGTLVQEPHYDYTDHFSGGLAMVRIGAKCGYLDTNLDFAILPRYAAADPFSEQRAVVEVEKDGKSIPGVISNDGAVVVGFGVYEWIDACHEGFMVFKSAGLRGLMDRDGRSVVSATFQTLGGFICGLARAATESGHGFVDHSGHFVIPPIHRATWAFHENLAAFEREDGLIGFLDRTGGVVIEPRKIAKLMYFSQGRCAIQTTEGWGLIDSRGRFVRKPDPGIIEIAPFFEGLAGFRTAPEDSEAEGLIGYMDMDGQIVIPPTCMDGEQFRDGIASVIDGDGGRAYINRTGKYVWREDRR